MGEVEHLVASQCKLGEGPVWHPAEQALYWLDIEQGRLHRYDSLSQEHTSTELGLIVSAMGIRDKGGFVMATKEGFALWDALGENFQFLGDLDPDQAQAVRFNDGKTDRQGLFWAGKMGPAPTNSLFRLDPNGDISRTEVDITCSNGLGWSPDNRIFYYTDSAARVIFAYDFDAVEGSISNRRVFTQVPNNPREGVPDGLSVDADGYIWSARWGGWKIVRYTPQGEVEREISLPVALVTSCAFGGPNLDELYITSAWTEVRPEDRPGQPLAGDVFRLKTTVHGLPEAYFGG